MSSLYSTLPCSRSTVNPWNKVTINVSVVFMARYVMMLQPSKQLSIKTTGTLVVLCTRVLLYRSPTPFYPVFYILLFTNNIYMQTSSKVSFFMFLHDHWSVHMKYGSISDVYLLFRIGRILRSKTREEVFTLCHKYDDNSQGQVLPFVI
jgi:hypothetical protein